MSFSYVNPNGTPLTSNPNLSPLPSGSDGSSEVDPTILNQASAAELTSLKLLAAVQPQITTDGVHLANGLVTTGDQAKINALPADTTAALAGKVSTATTVNGHALSGNVAVTTTDLSLNNLTNDAQTKAAIVPNTIPAAGQMLIGNAGGTAFAPVAASGDVTVTSTGAHTIANAAVTNAKLATVGAYTLKGNNTASTAAPADIAVTSAAIAALPNLSGTNTGDQTISITGDVTAAGGAGALTATVTKINGVFLAGLGTGLLKNTTGTGVPSIAIGADLPIATTVAPGAMTSRQATQLLPPVANDFDPTVTDYATLSTGYTPIIGSTLVTLDGTQSWLKSGVGALNWGKILRKYVSVTAAGGPLSALDGTIAADNGDSIHMVVTGASSGAAVANLRLNGALAPFESGFLVTGAGASLQTTCPCGVISSADARMDVDIGRSINGRRAVRVQYSSGTNTSYQGSGNYRIVIGAITSVGIDVGATPIIANGVLLTAVAVNGGGSML